MKKVVIFGATGNIGAYFTDYCRKNFASTDYEVVAVGRKKTDFFSKQGIQYIQTDITRASDFERLPLEDVYAVVNLTGLLPAYTQKYDPFVYIDTNFSGSVRILEYARAVGADRTLYTQTWSDQGGYWGTESVLSPNMPRKLIYTGDHAFYAITKTAVCETMEHYRQEFGLKSFIFRLPNVYMYHPDIFYYVNCEKKPVGYRYMIERAKKGEPIEMWGDPKAFKDILYVKDLCQMMYKALFADIECGTYNAGTGVATTFEEQLRGIVDVFSPKDAPSEIVPRPEMPSFTSFVMDIENARRDLGYSPEFGYSDYLEDYRKESEEKRFDELWKG